MLAANEHQELSRCSVKRFLNHCAAGGKKKKDIESKSSMAQLLYLTETQQQKPEGCRRTELNGTTGWCQWGECRTRFISQKEKEGKYIVILCKNLKQNIPSSC